MNRDLPMNTEQLTQELRLVAEAPFARTPECPDEFELTAAAAGTLPAALRERLSPHFATCDYCLARLGELVRLQRSATSETGAGRAPDLVPDLVPSLVLARAAKFGRVAPRREWKHRVRPHYWATAAVVALVFALVLDRPWLAPPSGEEPVGATAWDAPGSVRRIDPDAILPRIIWPTAGSTLDEGDTPVRWTPIVGTLYYDLQVLSDDGAVLWRERITEPMAALPDALGLEPDREYFLRVDAYLAESRSVSSPHVVFSVRPRAAEGFR